MSASNGVRTLIFDESGNMGKDGRYFVIACIDTNKPKSLHNLMFKKLKKAKETFPSMVIDGYEVKAANAFPAVKYHVLESISLKDLSISYIVADLCHIEQRLLRNKNCLYNYLLKILIDNIIDSQYCHKKLNLRLDNKTIKVESLNSFSDYINIHLNYERCLDIDLDVKYIDSKSRNGFIVQASDYVANAVYSYYEYNYSLYYKLIERRLLSRERFPRSKFGLANIV